MNAVWYCCASYHPNSRNSSILPGTSTRGSVVAHTISHNISTTTCICDDCTFAIERARDEGTIEFPTFSPYFDNHRRDPLCEKTGTIVPDDCEWFSECTRAPILKVVPTAVKDYSYFAVLSLPNWAEPGNTVSSSVRTPTGTLSSTSRCSFRITQLEAEVDPRSIAIW